MLNSQIISLLLAPQGRNLSSAWLGSCLTNCGQEEITRAAGDVLMLDVPCSAKWEHLPPLLPQSPSGAMSPLLFLLQSWKYLIFLIRQGRGSRQPKTSSSSRRRSSKARSTPRQVWLWSLQCLKHLLCATPCASQPPQGHSTSLVRPHRAGLRVQERFPSNPSALSNLPGSPCSVLQAGCHSRQPRSLCQSDHPRLVLKS